MPHPVRAFTSAALLAAAALAQGPCFDRSFGTNLNLGDDAVSAQSLGFAFPFAGTTVSTVTVCSNGFLWLDGTTTSTDFSPTEAELLSQAPRLAALWADLYAPGAPAGGGVFFSTVPAAAGAPARAVITWDRVPFYGNRAMLLSMQVILDDTGTIRVSYDATSQFYATPTIVGLSAGMGVAANPVDFSTQPLNTGNGPTIHESFRIGTAGAFDLGGVNQLWIPSGTGGYVVVQTSCPVAGFLRYGTGCPRNGTAYEAFVNNVDLANTSTRLMATANGYVAVPGPGFDLGYASQIAGVGDDTIHQGLSLGFTFPFEGTTVSTVDLSSNGYLWVSSSATSDFSPSVAEFLSQTPRIAALWRDLDARTAGAVYWDVTPGYAMATWIGVPNYSNATGANSFQIKLYASGDIELNYGTLDAGNPTNSAVTLVGITEGGNASDPGSVDLTAQTPGLFIGAPGRAPLSLHPASGSLPVLGAPMQFDLDNVPAGTVLTVFAFGFQRTAVDASVYGMTGCTQHTSLDFTNLVLHGGGPTSSMTLQIPGNPALLGQAVFSQGLSFSQGFNPLGVIASNGGELRLGW